MDEFPDEAGLEISVEDVPDLIVAALELLAVVETHEALLPDEVKLEAWAFRARLDELVVAL